MDERLTSLETKLAHLEFSLEKVSQEIESQKKAFYRLEKSLDQLQSRMEKFTSTPSETGDLE